MTKPLRPFQYTPPQTPLKIIHKDDDILALSKPAGLLSVPGRAADHQDCLQTRVRDLYPSALTIHRLDMATSGLVIMALNKTAQSHLAKQFEKRQVKKIYIALVWGSPEQEKGLVDLPLICDWPNRPLQKVDFEHGKPSQTHWHILEREANQTRIELTPITGRSHQLRVHMKELGCPILGDEFYAHEQALNAANRLCLNAEKLQITHPKSEEVMQFQDTCPF